MARKRWKIDTGSDPIKFDADLGETKKVPVHIQNEIREKIHHDTIAILKKHKLMHNTEDPRSLGGPIKEADLGPIKEDIPS